MSSRHPVQPHSRPPRPEGALSRLRALPLALLILLLWIPVQAFISLTSTSTDQMPILWDLDETTLALPNVDGGEVIYQQDPLGSDDIVDSSDLGAVDAGFRHWEGIPRSRIAFSRGADLSLQKANDDGINVVFWAELYKTQVLGNKNFRVEGFVGLTVLVNDTAGPTNGLIRNADIILNGYELTWTTDPATDPNAYDVEEIVTHEVGHVLGLDHSGVVGSTMYGRFTTGEVRRRTLDHDDIHGASSLYPDQDQLTATGAQTGLVQNGLGGGVIGALIATMDADGVVQSEAISFSPDGSYYSPGLPPGAASTYFEALDDPALGATSLIETADLGSIWATAFTEFVSVNDSAVTIPAGGSTFKAVAVGLTAPTIHISAIGQRADTTPGDVVFSTRPTALFRGDTNVYVGVSGVNINNNQIFEILGTGVTVNGVAATGSANGEPAVVYDVSVDPNAPLGLRSMRVTFSGERTYATGAVEVMDAVAWAGGIAGLPPAPPTDHLPGLTATGEDHLRISVEPGGLRLFWATAPAVTEYNLWRGDLATLATGGYNHAPLPGPNGGCGLIVPSTLLVSDLTDGVSRYYIVNNRNVLGESGLGVDDTGAARPRGSPDCP